VTSAGDRRFRAVMLGLFAVSGLLLALVGVLKAARYQAWSPPARRTGTRISTERFRISRCGSIWRSS